MTPPPALPAGAIADTNPKAQPVAQETGRKTRNKMNATDTEIQTVIDAISHSQAMDQIVHIRRARMGHASELRIRAGDHSENQKAEGRDGEAEFVSEYWGEDEGGTWRVIIHTTSEA